MLINHLIWGRRMQVGEQARARVMAMSPAEAIQDRRLLWQSIAVLAVVILAFVLHHHIRLEAGTIALAGAVSLLFRALLGVTILRLRGDYLAVVTMGFGEIARLTINNLDDLTRGPKGMQAAAIKPI